MPNPSLNRRYAAALRELQGRPQHDLRPVAIGGAFLFGFLLLALPRPAAAVTTAELQRAMDGAPRIALTVALADGEVVTRLWKEGARIRYETPGVFARGFDGKRTWSVSYVDKLATVAEVPFERLAPIGRLDVLIGDMPLQKLGPGHVRAEKTGVALEVWFDPATNRPTRVLQRNPSGERTVVTYAYPNAIPASTFQFQPPAGMKVLKPTPVP